MRAPTATSGAPVSSPPGSDYDNDGDPDLYIVNDFGEYIQPNVLWRNDGPAANAINKDAPEWTFTDVSQSSGAGAAMFGMGLAVADYNSDGHLDLFVTNIGDNVLLAGDGGGDFSDTAAAAGVAHGEFRRQQRVSWGAVFFDYDNDGHEDLYVASGFLDTDDINRRQQPNLLFRNNGAGGFDDVSAISGAADWGIGRGAAYADFNADGCLDLYVANLGRSAAIGEPRPAVSEPLPVGPQLANRQPRRQSPPRHRRRRRQQPRRHRRPHRPHRQRTHPNPRNRRRRQQLLPKYATRPLRPRPGRGGRRTPSAMARRRHANPAKHRPQPDAHRTGTLI